MTFCETEYNQQPQPGIVNRERKKGGKLHPKTISNMKEQQTEKKSINLNLVPCPVMSCPVYKNRSYLLNVRDSK